MTFTLTFYNNEVATGEVLNFATGCNFNRSYGRETVTFPRPKKMQKGFDLGFCSGDIIRINGTFTDGWSIPPDAVSNIMTLFHSLLYKGPHVLTFSGISWTVLIKSIDATSEPGQGDNIVSFGLVLDIIDASSVAAFTGCQTY
jgi:hypothetical protein